MKPKRYTMIAGAAGLLLAGCASVPNAPSQLALPGSGQTFEQFRADDAECRRYAFQAIGGKEAEDSAKKTTIRDAAIGTTIGTVAGAAIGGRDGAAVGAGAGLLVGSAVGADSGQRSVYGSQQQYDHAYIQCMYAKGHKVPVPASMARVLQEKQAGQTSPAPAVKADGRNIPPPPPGSPPPPPPAP